MELTLVAKPLVGGEARGSLLLLDEPLSLWGGLDPESGEVIDRRHPASGTIVTGRILAMPCGRGSSSASSVLLEAVRLDTAPAAIVLAEPDGILALGSLVARELYGKGPPILVLGTADYERLSDGQQVRIGPDGQLDLEVD